MLFRYPARFGDMGKSLPGTIATEDVMPTVLRLCGLRASHAVQGLDFSRYMSGGKDPTDGAAIVMCPVPFSQCDYETLAAESFRAISVHAQRYTYGRDLSGHRILFDNQADPYQINNRIDNPRSAKVPGRRWIKLAQTQKLKLKSRYHLSRRTTMLRKWRHNTDSTGTVPYDP